MLGWYENAKEQLTTLKQENTDRLACLCKTEWFMKELKQQGGLLFPGDDELWHNTVDKVWISFDSAMEFAFRNGTRIAINIEEVRCA